MTHRPAILALAGGILSIALTARPARPPADGDPVAASPTGRTPVLGWTAARQATWERILREGPPILRSAQAGCQAARTGKPRYGDRGLWCTWLYQVTGDPSIGRAAWRQARGGLLNPPASANDVRENFIENAIVFDWLRPVLTDAERDSAVAGLNRWAEFALAINTKRYQGGFNYADSDALVGYYFGLAATDLATRGLPGHRDWLDARQASNGGIPVGGLVADAATRTSARNALHRYLTGPAAGGQWIESSAYNTGTVALLALGYGAIGPATDPEAFADVRDFLESAGSAAPWRYTPDLAQPVQWGDEEHPRELRGRLFRHVTSLALLAGVLGDTPGGREAQGVLLGLFDRYGATGGYGSAEPWPRAALFWDPWQPAHRMPPDSTWRFNAGMGHLLVRHDADLASLFFPPRTGAQHQVGYLGTFQLYRRGAWALTQPIGYGGAASRGDGSNGGLVAGLSTMLRRGVERLEHGDDWWAITASTGGPLYDGGYRDPPPPFLEQWRRTVVHFRRDGIDYFVTRDVLVMQDPRRLPKLERYRNDDRAAIQSAPGLFQWVIHAPVAPDTTEGEVRWRTAAGDAVLVRRVGGPEERMIVLDERELYQTYHVSPSERKWQVRLVPEFTGGTTTLIHVTSVGGDRPVPVSLRGDTLRIGGTSVVFAATGVAVDG